MSDLVDSELRAKLNADTGKLAWPELERYFARGVVIVAAPGLDLVDAAVKITQDDKEAVKSWMESGELRHPEMDDARDWLERQPIFWALVVAPWVLIQELADDA